MEAPAPGKKAVALAWLSNPVVVWGGGILLALFALRFLVPGLLGGIWDKLKGGADTAIDSFNDNVASILGAKGLSQDPNRQLTTPQKVGSVFAEGDRGLSDLLDYVGLQ